MLQTFPIEIPVILFVLSLLASFLTKYSFKELFGINWKKKYGKQILIGTAGLLIIGFGLDMVSNFFGLNDTQAVSIVVQEFSLFPVLTILFLIFSALGEELFFRGAVQKYAGILPSAILFTLTHIAYGSMVVLAGAFIAGYWLSLIREKNNSILPGFIAHAGYNLVVVLSFVVW
jgi:membrane protease YdiL (CAAX protease family)